MQSFRYLFIAILAMILFASSTTPFAKSKNSTVIGVQLYSFRNQIKTDLPGTLAKIKAMGLTQIESYPHGLVSAAEFRAMLDKAGLTCVSTHADYHELGKDLDGVAKEAKTLGAKYVIVAWIPHGNTFTLDDCNRAIANFNDWGARLAKHGLRFAYHTHGYEFQPHAGGTLLDKMIAETNPKYVAFQMDVFWVAQPGQNPVALLKKYPKRFELLHLKDMKAGTPKNFSGGAPADSDVVLGTGEIDIAGVVRAARKLGIRYHILEDESSQVMTQIPESLKYLKKL
ncbi:MAG: sugar phosphate isomerase/epimerase [Acidobacteriota bacterium]